MKIAMLGHKVVPSRRGGIETVLTNLCPLLVRDGNQVTCYNRSGDKVEGEYLEMLDEKGFSGVVTKKALTLPLRGLSAMIASYTAAIAAAFGKYDVVHFHAEGPCAAMWIPKLFGKKCVATVHGLDWQREKWGSGIGAKYIKLGEKTLVKRADAVIVLSESAREYFQKTYSRNTIVIPNGISKPEIRSADIITKEFGLEKDSYICLASRLTEEKGVHFLIEAFRQLKTDKKLVICGDTSDTDEYVAKLREMAKGDDRILFTGFISGEKLAEMYSNAYLVCLPSTLEGMSLSLLEALSYGNAVVCSDIPENTSVCDGYARFFRKGDSSDLRDQLRDLLDHPETAEDLKSRASDYVCEKYSWEKTEEKTLEIYKMIHGRSQTE